jgi:hypothetical protein
MSHGCPFAEATVVTATAGGAPSTPTDMAPTAATATIVRILLMSAPLVQSTARPVPRHR